MKTSMLLAALLAAGPVLAHGAEHHVPANHAKKGAHDDAPTSFDKQPAPGTWARCAVSDEVFQVDKDTQFSTYQGRVYAFCCDDCKPDFDKDPARYALKKS